MKFTKFDTLETLRKFMKTNPSWVSGFVDGEGCFTGSFQIDKRSTWGLQPQAEFNLVQNNVDRLLLEVLKEHFNNRGGVYARPNNMSVYSVRNTKDLREVIIPYFISYPLISNKARELETFYKYLDLLSENKHVGNTLNSRDQFLKLALILKELNAKRLVGHKSDRLDLIIDWLNNLTDIPSVEAKLNLRERAKQLKLNKNDNDLLEISE